MNYRFLSAADFPVLHQTFLEAFSDYVVPFQLSAEQLENHIAQNSVDLERCVGAFSEDRMVGFTLNGFGVWNDRPTVYDAGTGVVPDFRRKGIGRAIFDFMTPKLKADGFGQILLEVISHNQPAVRLYEKLGFETTRRLIFFERKETFAADSADRFEIREETAPDWDLFEKFGQGHTSWQNSTRALTQTARKIVLSLFSGKECVGYGVIFPGSGIIPQLAVAPEFRRRGAGAALLQAMQTRIENNKFLRASNVDENLADLVGFLKKRGFVETFSQFEMIKAL